MNIDAAMAAVQVLHSDPVFQAWWAGISMKERLDFLHDIQLAIEQEVY